MGIYSAAPHLGICRLPRPFLLTYGYGVPVHGASKNEQIWGPSEQIRSVILQLF